ncbi:MAG: hypothetical protein AAGF47_07975 [Planctomycetota bacterium]
MTRAAFAHALPFGRLFGLIAAVLALASAGCLADRPRIAPEPGPSPDPVLSSAGPFEITSTTTAEGFGAGQAIFLRGNFVYILGDRYDDGTEGPGVIREFFWSTDARGNRALFFGGREIILTENGQDVAKHPTGLTWHPNFGYWLGDTVDQRGTLFQIDFDLALSRGTLDGSIIRTIEDNAAVNGTRPEFITLPGGRVVLATSDYGDTGNALRLYDPVALLTAERTSDDGVLFAEHPCGPFVQTLEPGFEPGEVYLVQNRTPGLGYRLTLLNVDDTGRIRGSEVFDFEQPTDELEGFAWLETDRRGRTAFMMLSASRSANVVFGRWSPERPLRR